VVRVVDPAQLLSLNCFVLGDKPNEMFTVKVPKTDNVSILKKMIKEEKSPDLDHISASKLILTQVSLAVDDGLGEILKGIELTPLNPVLPLSQVFPRVEENHLHVIVQAPSKGKPISVVRDDIIDTVQRAWMPRTPKKKKGEIRSLLWIKVRIFFPLLSSLINDITGFQNVISRILNAMPPSDSAKSSNYTKSQIAYSIYDGRFKANKPRTSVAPPVQLFHPVFGHFLDVVNDNHALPDDIIRKTTEYMKAASAIYVSEEERRAALTPLLCDILKVNIQMILNKDKTIPDGIVEMAKGILLFLILLKEEKNEVGDGGSDPSTQSGLSTARCWAQDKVC